jgi:hypothetical protein
MALAQPMLPTRYWTLKATVFPIGMNISREQIRKTTRVT